MTGKENGCASFCERWWRVGGKENCHVTYLAIFQVFFFFLKTRHQRRPKWYFPSSGRERGSRRQVQLWLVSILLNWNLRSRLRLLAAHLPFGVAPPWSQPAGGYGSYRTHKRRTGIFVAGTAPDTTVSPLIFKSSGSDMERVGSCRVRTGCLNLAFWKESNLENRRFFKSSGAYFR